MIPKIHKKGKSFAGVTRYVMHDKDAETDHRVEWSTTLNMGTDNPRTAARVMAATAMDQARLKQEAGIKNTGRKSKDHVFHATLSWHADEAPDLDRSEMERAARWFLQKLGAEDRQTILVAHNDEPQPHVHIIVNRVSAKDGRILSSSLERIKASEWAEKYERDRGKILVDQRVINNQARKRGEYVRGQKDQPRHFHEMQQIAANDPKLAKKVENEIEKMRKVYRQKMQQQRQARTDRENLDRSHRERITAIREGTDRQITVARERVQEQFRQEWETEYHEAAAQQAAFMIREKTFLGRVSNALESVDWKAIIRMQQGHPDGRAGRLGEAFNAFGDAGARAQILAKQQALRENAIKQRQNLAEADAVTETRRDIATRMRETHRDYQAERSRLEEHEKTLQAALDNQVTAANRLRRQSLERMLEEQGRKPVRLEKTASQEAGRKPKTTGPDASAEKNRSGVSGRPASEPTKASDLLPKKGSQQAADAINDRREKLKKRLLDKKNEPDRGDEGQSR